MHMLYVEAITLAYDIVLRAGGGTGGGHISSGGGGYSGSSGSSGGGWGGGYSSNSYSSSNGGSYSSGEFSLSGLLLGGAVFLAVMLGPPLIKAWFNSGKISAGGIAGGLAAPDERPATSSTGLFLDGTDEASLRQATLTELNEGIEAIRAHDPDFDQAAFTALVGKAFFAIQQGWTERNPELTRQVMADGIWQAHKFQIEQYISQGKQNVLESLRIQSTNLVAASVSGGYDTVMVRFFAACADYDIDLADGNKVVRGSKNIEEWCEDWCFQRSSDATTKVEGGTFAKKCPNCGAPLAVDLTGTCDYCKAPIMGGKYDWVLTRIEQLPSWEFGKASIPS